MKSAMGGVKGGVKSADAPPGSMAALAAPGIAIALALGLFAWLWLDYAGHWIDDAFISFRYARNLAEGLGPVYNAGERVAGYTNFLWMLACAGLFAFLSESAALAGVKGLGLLLGGATLWRCATFPTPDGRPATRWLVLLLATQPVFVFNHGDGLETPLFTLLLVEAARAVCGPERRGRAAIAGLAAAGACLTRPEALALLPLWPLLALGFERPAGWRRWLGVYAACACLPVVLQLAWSAAYYGDPLPNTYAAKATGALLPRLERGALDLMDFAWSHPFLRPAALWTALALAVYTLVQLPAASAASRRWHATLGLLVAFRAAFDVWSGAEFMGVFRFLSPLLPPLFVLADEGLTRAVRGRLRFAVAVCCAASLFFNLAGHRTLAAHRARYEGGLEAAHVALGRWLRETRPPEALLAIGDAGAVPFFSRLPTIDLWGLNDARIARLPGEYGDKPDVPDYALGRRPDVVVLWSTTSQATGHFRGFWRFDREIFHHPAFRRDFRFEREFVFREERGTQPGYYLLVFLRQAP